MSKAKTSNVEHPAPAAPVDLALFYSDLNDWPRSWCGTDGDIVPGEQIVDCFRPFLEHLAARYVRKTIRLHAGNLWILGGELIRDLNQTPRLRKEPIGRLLSNLLRNGRLLRTSVYGDQQRSFDSTCNKFLHFLEASSALTR